MSFAFSNRKIALLLSPIISLTVGLLGVLVFGWDWRQMLVLYWFYNITAGLIALMEIARSNTRYLLQKISNQKDIAQYELIIKIMAAWFFVSHYGVFTLVHGIFVFSIIGGGSGFLEISENTPAVNVAQVAIGGLVVLVVSVLVKLIMPGEKKELQVAVVGPYGRIITLHITIIFGAALIYMTDLPNAAALLLVGLNTIVEILWLKAPYSNAMQSQHRVVSQTTPPDSADQHSM